MKFYKVSGAGNDFIALVEVEATPRAEAITAWCRRGLSIGADGLFILTRVEAGQRMDYFNADGRRAELCLNGTRCAAQLARHLGWIVDRTVIHTDSGLIAARVIDDRNVSLELHGPERGPEPQALMVDDQPWHGWSVTVGNPHFVVFHGSEGAEAFEAVAPRLRSHPDLGDAGANVHFVEVTGFQGFSIRSFERGVEAETMACGTGVLATVAAGLAHQQLTLPTTAHTRGGYLLEVGPATDGDHFWSLTGDARVVFEGRTRGLC